MIVVTRLIFALTLLCLLSCNSITQKQDSNRQNVTVDYGMAETTIAWLEFVNTGADEKAAKKEFFRTVSHTAGFKVIIRHWQRFMKWDGELFYNYIAEAAGIVESDNPEYDSEGALTNFGRRKKLWTDALNNPAIIRNRLNQLKEADVLSSSVA